MSNSRLEKFIYAICGMDVDDLPTPLSRIETLWNCLITGEVPDFEPLSRNEKYLMSMLTGDVDALPEPTSRSEKLLYKIATGETDLTDVPGYLSRYEELLKYLIENGGIGGTDFEYVLYTLNDSFSTLYSTAEAPVKSAILKGNTLVNLAESKMVDLENNRLQTIKLKTSLKANTDYTLVSNISNNDNTGITLYGVNETGSLLLVTVKNNGLIKTLLPKEKITSDCKSLRLQLSASEYESGRRGKFDNIVLLEGDYTNVDIPYFEGMQSVKMPVLTTAGKNLYPSNDTLIYETSNKHYLLESRFKSNTRYTTQSTVELTKINGKWAPIIGYEYTDGSISEEYFDLSKENIIGSVLHHSITSKAEKTVSKIYIRSPWGVYGIFSNIQIEESPIATAYEPYKSNILTTTSKNLFDMNRPYDVITDSQATVTQNLDEITVSSAESGVYVNANFILDRDFFAGKTVTGSCLYESDEKDIGTVQITYQDGNGEHHYQWIRTPRTFTFPNSFIGDVMLSISANNTGTPQSNTVTVKNIQLELGSTATPYEPYSEVTLRGIGEVKDMLDGNTGELTQRIGELVLDGDTTKNIYINWAKAIQPSDGYEGTYVSLPDIKAGENALGMICSTLPEVKRAEATGVGKECVIKGNTYIGIVLKANSYDDLLSKLAENPITVQYQMKESTIKTVALSTLDQDGQPTKLSTFNDVTHVSIEAEDLLPTVDLEVPTKIEETLSTLPTLMNDISETQQSLNECIDDQAENINEVSTAMAEIHNDIL